MSFTIPGPTSTGGGGTRVEARAVADALALLLIRATPPLLTDAVVIEVVAQARYLGWRTDDLLVIGRIRRGEIRRLAIQAKRNVVVSDKDDDCVATIRGMWDDFVAVDRFDPSRDLLAIAT